MVSLFSLRRKGSTAAADTGMILQYYPPAASGIGRSPVDGGSLLAFS